MKSGDEIKKGLWCCTVLDDCKGCPYLGDGCHTKLKKELAEYIQQLEAESKDTKINHQHTIDIAEKQKEQIKKLKSIIVKLNKERGSRWINVEDEQKPKHLEDVLCRYVFSGDSECFYAVLTYYAHGDNGYVTGPHFRDEGLCDMRVTHWMPLPEPPKEVTP